MAHQHFPTIAACNENRPLPIQPISDAEASILDFFVPGLDEALIRPGRVDNKVELGLADKKMTADLFCHVFKPVQEAVALPKDAQSGDNAKAHEAAVIHREKAERVEQLAKEFAGNVPELKFSPAEIFSFLMKHRNSPEEAIGNMEKLISKPIEAKSKPPRISEDAKPEDTRPEIAQASKWDEESSTTEVPTEMVQTPLASRRSTAPPGSPIISPFKHFLNLSEAQELVKAVMDMQMASAHAPKCTCSHTPPEDLSDATSTDLCSPTPCPPFAANRPLAYNMMGFHSPTSAVSTPQSSSSSSPASHASNYLSRSAFITRILADPVELRKDVSDYQAQLDPQGLICTNYYEDASGAIIFYPTYCEIITRIETVFEDLKQICRSASLIAPKSGNAYGIQMVFEVEGALVLGKMEIDVNVYRWVTRNLSKQKFSGHCLKL